MTLMLEQINKINILAIVY